MKKASTRVGVPIIAYSLSVKTPRAFVSSSDTVTEDLPVMSACCRFLVSVPECQNILSPVYALLVARTQNYSQVFGGNPLLDVGLVVKYLQQIVQVLQLRGKLDMVMKQNENKQTDNNLDIEQEPLAGGVEWKG